MSQEILQDPADLLKQTRSSFSIQHDLTLFEKLTSNLKDLHDKITQVKSDNVSRIKQLQERLETTQLHVNKLTTERHSIQDHLNSLTTSRELVEISDELKDLEHQLCEMRSQIDSEMNQLVSMNFKLTDEMEIPKDLTVQANLLKLQLYRSFGLVVDLENNQALIKKRREIDGDIIDVIPLSDNTLSCFFRTKYIWDRL